MPAVYGKQSTYDQPNLGTIRVSIEDLVEKYPAKEFPLLKRLDSSIFKKEVDNAKYEWKEETLRAELDTLNDADHLGSGDDTVVADTPGVFNKDDVIQIGSEQMIVHAVNSDGVTLSVTRGWANTTPATHNDGATIRRIGIAAPEGADADGAVRQPLVELFNRTQIFEDVVEMSGTEEEAFIYRTQDGGSNSANQITTKQKELMEMLQTALFLGRRHDDPTGKRRTMGGLKFFIDTYAPNNAVDFGGSSTWTDLSTMVPSGNTAYTEGQEKLDNLIERIVAERGKPSALYVGYKALRRMSLWDIEKMDTDRNDKRRGTASVGTYISQAGNLDVIQIPGRTLDDLIFVVDEDRIGYKAFKNRGWFTKKLGEVGDSSKWQVLGEYTEKVSTPKVHGYMYNLGL